MPEDYDIELMEITNGQKIDERISPYLRKCRLGAARAEGIYSDCSEGYRTENSNATMTKRVQAYINRRLVLRAEKEQLIKLKMVLPGNKRTSTWDCSRYKLRSGI